MGAGSGASPRVARPPLRVRTRIGSRVGRAAARGRHLTYELLQLRGAGDRLRRRRGAPRARRRRVAAPRAGQTVRMAITPKKIIGTAVGLGRGAFSLGAGLLRRDETSERPTTPATPAATSSPATARGTTSGAPSTVGAPKPGEPRGVKSATA